jgi:uncharacterized protein (TIGR02246 family)
MTRINRVLTTAIAVLLLTGTAAFAQQDAVRRVLTDEYVKAESAGSVDAKMRLYMADAVLLPVDGQAVVGYQAIRNWHQGAYERAAVQLTPTVDEVQMLGDWAFARGSWTGTTTPKAGGEPRRESGKFVILMRRLPDGGSWRIAREMWNAQPASADLR